MNYATIKENDIANGPGIRVSLFVSGCTHHCKDCFNSEAWDFDYGESFTQVQQDRIIKALDSEYKRGFSLLGGEPFEPQNQRELVGLLRRVKAEYPHKDIWCYTGYIFEELRDGTSRACTEVTGEMLKLIDFLVDGPFVAEKKNLSIKFRGSENQRIIDVKKSLEQGEVVLWEHFNDKLGG